VLTAQDYYSGGMLLPGRTYQAGSGSYRYGFQNQEIDKEFWGGAVAFEYRVEDPRIVRFFSVDPLSDDYAWNSPYAFAENRLMDGIELEGLEWKPTKDKEGNVTSYTWAGYNRDGSPVKGTVEGGALYNKEKNYFSFYSSNRENQSGSVDFMSAGSKEHERNNEMPNPTATNNFNVTINYKDNWVTSSSLMGSYRKEVSVNAELWNENSSIQTGTTVFNRNMGVSPSNYNDPQKFLNSLRYGLGFADGPTGGALVPVYPEALLLPLPKGLNLLGKSFNAATGGAKQWLRLGRSYSVEGGFKTYGLRWGASPRYASKIGNVTLRQINQDFRKWKVPFKSWRTIDPGHLHLWKLK
jgi:hypothetical protein